MIALLAALALAGCGDDGGVANEAGSTQTMSDPVGPVATTADGADSEAGQPDSTVADDQRPLTIEQTVEAVLTSSAEPAVVCDELVTAEYVRVAYGAREGCLAAQKPGALADSVSGGVGTREGDTATVTVVPRGGPYDDVEVRAELVRDADGWRLDSLLADVPAGP